jgi:hypothetical protein
MLLFRLDTHRFDDRPPLFNLGRLQPAKRPRRLLFAGKNLLADIGEPCPYARCGKRLTDSIKAYAVMAKSRLAAVPDVPTVDEAGSPGTYFSGWFALWAPAGTPKDIIAR